MKYSCIKGYKLNGENGATCMKYGYFLIYVFNKLLMFVLKLVWLYFVITFSPESHDLVRKLSKYCKEIHV